MKRLLMLALMLSFLCFCSCEYITEVPISNDEITVTEDIVSDENGSSEAVGSNENISFEKSPPEITEPFLSVLRSEVPFYSSSGEVEYFSELYDYTLGKFIDKDCSYAFVDMNSDGKEELLVQGIDTVVLSDMGDSVFGFAVNFRALADVCEDGTFGWNYTGFDGLHYGTSVYNTDWTVTNLFSIHQDDDNDVTKYFIEEKEVTKDEYYEYESKFASNQVTFYPLDYKDLTEKE